MKIIKEDIEIIEVPEVVTDLEISEEEPKGPEVGMDIGIANILHDLIIDENEAIQGYNTALANVENYPEIAAIIQDIANEEFNHIGMLNKALEIISPNVSKIAEGELEAVEGDMEEAPAEVVEVPVEIMEEDIEGSDLIAADIYNQLTPEQQAYVDDNDLFLTHEGDKIKVSDWDDFTLYNNIEELKADLDYDIQARKEEMDEYPDEDYDDELERFL